MTDILDTMGLVNQWLKYVQSRGLSNSAGLRELNEAVGTDYKDNSIYIWRSGSGQPGKEAAKYMRQCVAKMVLDERLNMDVHPKTAKAIADDLS